MSGYTQEDVRKILEGSEELNRKKREMGRILSMVAGLIKDETLVRFKKHTTVTCVPFKGVPASASPRMVYQLVINRGDRDVVASLIGRTIVTQSDDFFYGGLARNTDSLPLNFVESLYNTLPDMLNELCKIFPNLSKELAFLINAAEHKTETA